MSSHGVSGSRGALFVVCGPSGVGKSTLIGRAMDRVPGLSFSVSATTRAPRQGEQDGVNYHFLPHDRFDALVRDGAFLEHARVYDQRYGTLRAPTEAAIADGRYLLLDIDVQGADQVRAKLPEAVTILILPPSIAALESRLRARATDPAEVIARRMDQVAEQMAAVERFDYAIVNDDLHAASRAFEAILVAEQARVSRQPGLVAEVLRQLAARHGPGVEPPG